MVALVIGGQCLVTVTLSCTGVTKSLFFLSQESLVRGKKWTADLILILSFPSPGDLPDSGMEPGSPELQANSLLSEPLGKTFECTVIVYCFQKFIYEKL